MPAAASYPAPRPVGYAPAAATSPQSPGLAATGCAGCCVRPYCALATPDSLCPPANCPFGLGQAAR